MGYKLAVSSSLIYQFSLIGYAVPGTVIAVGLMLVLDSFFGVSITLFGITGLIVCLVIRFLPIGYRYFSTALDQIPKNNTHVLALHNLKAWPAFKSGYLGFLKKPFMFGFLFITIECMKEQPATILLRPSGFETLSTQVYNFTTEGQWELAANPSLVLVIISTLLFSLSFSQNEEIKIAKVEVEGNEVTSKKTIIFTAGLREGQTITTADFPRAIKRLWQLNLFQDVQIHFN